MTAREAEERMARLNQAMADAGNPIPGTILYAQVELHQAGVELLEATGVVRIAERFLVWLTRKLEKFVKPRTAGSGSSDSGIR